jgi:hypothetical protein
MLKVTKLNAAYFEGPTSAEDYTHLIKLQAQAIDSGTSALRLFTNRAAALSLDQNFEVDAAISSLEAREARLLEATGLVDEEKQEALTFNRAYSLIDYSPESGKLSWKQRSNPTVDAGSQAGFNHSSGQRLIKIDNNVYRLNRLIWLLQTGEWPTGRIKHKNNNPKDLRWSNLYEEGVDK